MLKDEEKGGLKMCSQHPLRKKHYKMPHSCALAQPLALLLMPFSIEQQCSKIKSTFNSVSFGSHSFIRSEKKQKMADRVRDRHEFQRKEIEKSFGYRQIDRKGELQKDRGTNASHRQAISNCIVLVVVLQLCQKMEPKAD